MYHLCSESGSVFSSVCLCVCVCVCLPVNTITPQPLEILSQNFKGEMVDKLENGCIHVAVHGHRHSSSVNFRGGVTFLPEKN